MGSAAVSIAKTLGASHVAAVCSKKDAEKVRQLGADVVIDRHQDKNWKSNGELISIVASIWSSMPQARIAS